MSSRFTCLAAVLLIFLCSASYAQNADIKLLRQINLHRDKSLDGSMALLSNSAYPVSAAVPLAQLIVGYAQHDKQTIRDGWFTVGGLAATGILAFGFKYTVNRTRPYVTYPDLQPYQHDADPSFPSGHTSFSFYTATNLSLRYRKWYVVVPSYVWAAAVGYSRLDLGLHYPSDVLAGAILGTATGWLTHMANHWMARSKARRSKPKAEITR